MSNENTEIVPYEPAGLAEYSLEPPAMRFDAHIVKRTAALSNDELLGIVKDKHALVSDRLKAEDMFFFPIVASNQRLDSYFTKMADNTLMNYAEDATNGVAFQNSHTRTLPVGKVFTGTFERTADGSAPVITDTDVRTSGDFPRVVCDVYTVRDLQLNAGLTTDNFIKGVETGIISDVSVGFKEGIGFRYTCSICGEDLWDWDCRHIPGAEYDVADNQNASPETQTFSKRLCFAWIENARLSEVSAVYDGSTPNAMILKATREVRAGRMTDSTKRFLESKYRINLPAKRVLLPGETTPPQPAQTRQPKIEEKNEVSKENDAETIRVAAIETQNKTLAEMVRGAVTRLGLTLEASASIEDLCRAVVTESERLKPLAVDGEAYRTELVTQALEEGIRAHGADFKKEETETTLRAQPLSMVKMMRDSWRGIGDKELGAGKRRSVDESEAGKPVGDKADEITTPPASERTEVLTENSDTFLFPESSFRSV